MRVVSEISHPDLKITIFNWNNRYLIKLETALMEQTFKVYEYDVSSEEEVKKMISKDFIEQAKARFNEMAISLKEAIDRAE
ncbi:MAG: hypothetical protein OJF59_003128 [Cytophagales bacterium]|jgi:hypothetical protein|nr:hypothetical protein [Bacteroidota bacterium]MBS1981924.1 hypothetical protein [Bacteroidota bacterium]WHZ09372.1 MAG: hypothetical protein OJF59_003128 [Cytophagales bacterium]